MLGILAFVLCGLSVASADRRRVVVLPFEGDKAEKFEEGVIKLLKKSHTVVPADKWSSTADDMGASKVSEKNVKKVAKKLKIDGVVTGKVEKRRDQYILRIRVRAGNSGDFVGNTINTKTDGAKLDSGAQRDLKDELVELVGNLDANRGGGGGDDEEEDEKPVKKKQIKEEDEQDEKDEKPVKKKQVKEEDEEDEKPVKKGGFSKKKQMEDEEETAKEDEDEKPAKKKKGSDDDEDEVASREDGDKDEDGEEIEESNEGGSKMAGAVALSPGNRAVDAVVGLSFNARRLSFKYDADLTNRPPGYKGVPSPGVLIDTTIYPLAFSHKDTSMKKNIGLTFMYDKVLLISSKDTNGNKLDTKAARYAIGAVFRYPFNKSATSPVIGGQFRYGRQNFTIGGMADIPNVNYTILDPGVFFRYPISPKIVLNVDAAFMLVTNTGAISKGDQYGPSKVSGFDTEFGLDYMVTKNIFARGAIRLETIGLTFNGGGNSMATNRDGDTADQDVAGARDTYFGGIATIGYLY